MDWENNFLSDLKLFYLHKIYLCSLFKVIVTSVQRREE